MELLEDYGPNIAASAIGCAIAIFGMGILYRMADQNNIDSIEYSAKGYK